MANKELLKKIWNVVFYVGLIVVVLIFVKRKFIVPAINQDELELVTYQKEPISLNDYKGEVVVLNFWQTWCGPCVHEMPSLNAMPQKWNQIKVIAVSDEPLAKIQKFKEKYPNIEFVQILNFNETSVEQFPTTYIFNKKGVKVYSKIGSKNWADDNFIAMLKKNYAD